MSNVAHQPAGIRVELDEKRLGQEVAREVAQHLAHLFPTDAAEFWAVLAEQAHRERQRVAAMLDLVCSHTDGCPFKPDIRPADVGRACDVCENIGKEYAGAPEVS